jgi:hypothetical protein
MASKITALDAGTAVAAGQYIQVTQYIDATCGTAYNNVGYKVGTCVPDPSRKNYTMLAATTYSSGYPGQTTLSYLAATQTWYKDSACATSFKSSTFNLPTACYNAGSTTSSQLVTATTSSTPPSTSYATL